ncbi:pyridoxal phosphate-dependent decarboxylase family protein [Metabacillus fastidiosus]|uniref:pyridoxal phosphate-dependent decarboxylase family protein n=1 Tax=Metabacillus fastidiosus TaxID=1458 RepID=UPI003D2E8A0A
MDLKEYFVYEDITKSQKDFLDKILDLGINFIEGSSRYNKVINYKPVEDLVSMFEQEIPEDGQSLDSLYKDLKEKVVPYSISQHDQRYLSFPDTGNSIAGLGGDILGNFLNQNLIAVDRSAPAGSVIEAQLILWLRRLIGYQSYSLSELPNMENLGGMWTSGGNMSNHIAILTALHNKFPEIKKDGLAALNYTPAIIVAKGVDHFSFKSAAQVLGLGEKGVLWADADENFTSNIDSIENILKNKDPEVKPFMVVAVAGNCRTTSIDDINALRKLCDKYNIWLHVDACHGGSLLFSDQLNKLVEGIEESDSVSLDPHKGLFVTYASSYVLFKDAKHLASFARYQEQVQEKNVFDLGLITPFYGSRGFNSLKLWMLIKHMGINGLKVAIEERHKIYQSIHRDLDETNLFVFFNDPTFYRSAFIFLPLDLIDKYFRKIERKEWLISLVNKYTKKFCQTLYESGEVVFDLFSLQDLNNKVGLGSMQKYTTIGLAVGHPIMSSENKNRTLYLVKKLGETLKQDMEDELENYNETEIYKEYKKPKVEIESPASW